MAITRRTFLKSSAFGVAATAAARSLPLFGNSADARPAGEIGRWVTNAKQRFAPADPISWGSLATVPGSETILLNPETKFQEILGFGAAFTDSACYMFNQLSTVARQDLFHELFHPSKMGLNVCRTCMGASDYSTKLYSYDEGEPDPELKRFSIAHDREYILPVLRAARAANPDLFLFSSPWSPPGWMKTGDSMLGGTIRRRYLPNYAQYFLKFLQGYAAEGVPIQAVTVQNEVDTDQDGKMPACTWPQEAEVEFVRDNLGPVFKQNGLATQIWIIDHNYNLWGRAIAELDDRGLRKYCNAVAWHGYVGNVELMSRVHDAHPDAQFHWTEGGPDYTDPDYLTGWTKWGRTFTLTLRNWCQSVTGWNLALDEHGQPNIGPFPCGGVVTIDSKSKEITRSGQYWAFAHFSQKVRRGAHRIDSQGTLSGVDHVAFENPDRQRVLVISNLGPTRTVSITMGKMQANTPLDENSLTTLVWS